MGNCLVGSDGANNNKADHRASSGAVKETFTKAVDTVADTAAFIDFGHIFSRDCDDPNHDGLDAKFKKRAEEAREGARRLRDVFRGSTRGIRPPSTTRRRRRRPSSR